jgi:hypothetical protein
MGTGVGTGNGGLGLAGGSSGGGVNTSPSDIRLDSSNGYGSTNTVISKWNTVTTNTGSDLTLTQSATDGDSITVDTSGWYNIIHIKDFGAAGRSFGISVNSTQLTTDIKSITSTHRIVASVSTSANFYLSVTSGSIYLAATDVIRAHSDGGADGSNSATAMLRVIGPL